MIVIYHDIGGTHSSAVAANLHLNKLPRDVIPDKSVILELPTYDKLQKNQWGHLIYAGKDEFGCSVYTMCRQRNANLVIPAVSDTYKTLNGSTKGLYLISTSTTVNAWMGIGGYSSRIMGLVEFGRPIVLYGTQKAYKKIVRLVDSVKSLIEMDLNEIKS